MEEMFQMMNRMFEKCIDSLSEEEKRNLFKDVFQKEKSRAEGWEMAPQMMMTMMNMMCTMMMRDTMNAGAKGGGPMPGGGHGMGGGPMGRPDPMKMMRRMMAGAFAKADKDEAKEKDAAEKEASDKQATG